MKESKTLIVITPGFPSNESDDTCLPAHQTFIRSLNKVFPHLKIVIISLQYPHHTESYQWYRNSVIPLNGKRIPKIARPFLWLKIYRQLLQISQHPVLGILSFWCHDGALVGNYFAKRNKLHHLCWVIGQDSRKGNPFVFLMKPKSDDLVAMSDFLADEFEKNYSTRPDYVVPNGINPDEFSTLKPERSIDLLAAGSLIPLKQYSIFLDVVIELIKVKPSLQAVLCGAGVEEEMLKRKIADLKLNNNIVLKGELPHKEVLFLMQQSKIFVHPSSFEGYSTVCLEALYAGCHVISFIAPEKRKIDHWYIVSSTDDMIRTAKELLTESDFTSVLVHHMDDSAREMMKLFYYNETITS